MTLLPLLEKAFERRAPLFSDPDTDCFRLFHLRGDGFDGLSIDRYGDYLLVQFFADALWNEQSRVIGEIEQACRRLHCAVKGILLKNRLKTGEVDNLQELRRSILVFGEEPPADLVVLQNGVRALVDLTGGQNTGIFLDMREIRESLKSWYAGCDNLLNLFSYTSLFSIHALKNGMRRAINIDLSQSVLGRAKRNYELNGLAVDARDFIYGDARQWTKKFRKRGERFSFIIFDPPTFSRNKGATFSVKRHYQESLQVLDEISGGGYIFTVINSYSLSRGEYLSFHPSGWEQVRLFHESSDFPHEGEPYLKAGLWKSKKIMSP